MAIADKFDLGFVGRLMRSRNGTVVGTLGDLLKSPRARDLYKEALGVPVMVLDRPVQGGKFVDSPDPNLRFFGACGSLRGKACIFVNPRWGEEETIRTLLEEGAHALRKLKGRPATKQDITALTSENIGEMHDSLPEEVSAKQMAEYVLKTAAQLPSVAFRQVWHIGSMDPEDKGKDSLEGAGLSISTHPEEWQQIAELGEGPVWELTRKGNRFLDFHRLTKAQLGAMADWGAQQGLIERRPAWQVRWWDSEDNGFRYAETETEEEAKEEAGAVGGKVRALSSIAYPTDRLRKATRNPRANSVVAMDLLATVYADKALGWDGVWWQDTLDVPGLSAPRGVILPSRLAGWQRRQVGMEGIEDYGAPGRRVSSDRRFIWQGRHGKAPQPGVPYYHVAPASYQEGQDIYSYDAYQDEFGEEPEWKWEEGQIGDTDKVSLHDSLEEAEGFREEWVPGGRVIEVVFPSPLGQLGLSGGVNGEGYPFVRHRIPGGFVRKVSSGRKTLEELALEFRERQEDWFEWQDDKACFREQCLGIARGLAKFLTENGIPAEPWHSYYYDDDGKPHNHWWVIAGGRVVDVTADQFHPEDPDSYRVVITSLDDPHYRQRKARQAGTESSPQSVPAMQGWGYDEPFPDRHSDFFELVENPHTDRGRETRVLETGAPPPEGGEGKPARGEPGQEGTLVRPMASFRSALLRKKAYSILAVFWVKLQGRILLFPNRFLNHDQILQETGIPAGGPEYDRMLRGRVFIDRERRRVRFTRHGGGYTPNDVVEEIVSRYHLQDWEMEDEGEAMGRYGSVQGGPVVERLGREDIPEALEVIAQCFPQYADIADVVSRDVRGDFSLSYGMRLEGRIIGCYLLGRVQLPEEYPGRPEAQAYAGKRGVRGVCLCLLPQYRGKGWGARLRAVPLSLGADYVWGEHYSSLDNLGKWTSFGRRLLFDTKDAKGQPYHVTVMDLRGGPPKAASSRDPYLYHVAQPGTLGNIARDGLQGGILGPKVFLTERAGVGFWRGYDASAPVLRMRRDLLEDLEPDDYGTQDSGSPCYSAQPVPPARLEFRVDTPQGEAWRPVRYALAKAASQGIPSFRGLVRELGGMKYLLSEVDIDEFDLEGSGKKPEEYIRGKFNEVRSFFAGLRYPIPVYRAISGDRSELRTKGFGTSWSMSEGGMGEQGAYPYEGNPSSYQVYSSHVSPRDINWTSTLLLAMGRWWDREKEIVVRNGARLRVGDDDGRMFEVTASFGKTALNVPKLVQDFGAKLVERYKADFPDDTREIDPAALINSLVPLDPTGNHEYVSWIVGNYARGELGEYDDIEATVIPLIERYHALKKTRNLQPQDTNIQRLRGKAALEALLARYAEVEAESRRQRAVSREQAFFRKGEAELVHDDPEMKVVIPETCEAAKFFGVNTRWCTSAESNNAFQQYHEEGPLYIVLLKRENKRFQFHFQTAQFTDEADRPLDIEEWLVEHPMVARLLGPLAEKADSECDECAGHGSSRCGECDGEGAVECVECGGSGHERCNDCQGRGRVPCGTCNGVGMAGGGECPACHGDQYEQCGSCHGTGNKKCEECDGRGSHACGSCENGSITCDKCGGTGKNPEMNQFLEGCQRALAGPLSVPALRNLRKKKWPALKKRVKDWIEPRRTPVHVGPRGMAFLQWLEGVKRRLKGKRGSKTAAEGRCQHCGGSRIGMALHSPSADTYWCMDCNRNTDVRREGVSWSLRDAVSRWGGKTAAGEWWRRWRKTEVLPKGTVLYHGTAQEFPGMDLSLPAWFSTSRSVAEHFQSWHGEDEGKHRLLMFRATRPIRLPRIDGREDLERMEDMFGLQTSYGAEDIVDSLSQSGLPGWVIPHNYPDGDDILLAETDSIEFTGQEPEAADEESGETDEFGHSLELPGKWTRNGDGNWVYHMTPEEIAERERIVGKKGAEASEDPPVTKELLTTRNPKAMRPYRPSLVTTEGNPKMEKGLSRGYLTGVMHLMPADKSGYGNVCPFSSAECRHHCLNTAGNWVPHKLQSRIYKTKLYFTDRKRFLEELRRSIARLARKAEEQGLLPAVRLNGTSDIPSLGLMMSREFPDITFYDYTRIPKPWQRMRGNYHLTFSRSGDDDKEVEEALDHGVSVAVVFDTKPNLPLPGEWPKGKRQGKREGDRDRFCAKEPPA